MRLTAFADDFAVVTMTRTEEKLMCVTDVALKMVATWTIENNLKLAKEKTKAVLLVGDQ